MRAAVDKARVFKQRGFWLRCFWNAALLLVSAMGWGGAARGYAAVSCPAPSQMGVSRMQGTVYGPSGVALPQIQVRVERDGTLVAQAESDERGRFEFKVAPGTYKIHLQFLGSKSMEMDVRVGRGLRGGFFHAARLQIVLGLSGARCSFATTSKKQFKEEIRRYQDRLVEVPPGP